MRFVKALGELLIGVLIGIGSILLIGGVLFLGAVGAVAIGWLAGVFVNWVFGGLVINGVNFILGTALAKSSLPAITGTLGFVSYLVRGGNTKSINQLAVKAKKNVKA